MKDWREVIIQLKNNKTISDATELLLKMKKELEDTKEALRRCRNLLESERELNERLVKENKELTKNLWINEGAENAGIVYQNFHQAFPTAVRLVKVRI